MCCTVDIACVLGDTRRAAWKLLLIWSKNRIIINTQAHKKVAVYGILDMKNIVLIWIFPKYRRCWALIL